MYNTLSLKQFNRNVCFLFLAPPEIHPSFAALDRLQQFCTLLKNSHVWPFAIYTSAVLGHCLYLMSFSLSLLIHITFLVELLVSGFVTSRHLYV